MDAQQRLLDAAGLLVGTNGSNSAQGSAVALSADGNLAMVGGYQDDFGKGAAWFFTRSSGTWSQQGDKVVGSGLVGLAQQGTSVALSSDGKTAITGGFGDDGYRGAAWIFTTWPAPSTPTGFDAAVQATTLVDLGWSASTNTDEYEIFRASSAGSLTLASTPATTYPDSTASPGEGYVYKVRALGPGGTSAYSTPAVAATFAFVNDPLVAGAIVRGVHVTEARDAVNAVRATAGLGSQSWTDSPLVSGSTPVRAAQILELRAALLEALGIVGVPAPSFANGIAAGTVVRAVDVQELRAAVH